MKTQTFIPKEDAYYTKAQMKQLGSKYSGKTIRDKEGKILRGPGYYIND
jgi:hypothetical protein